ncbi:conserved hypothetical protein [Theileria equi strain WA]|uniref:RNA-editing substrate-binding complex 6 protein domain-containing protein n=1 Tax=Theileria equi strain WA TaxID=1537102 RepID=L1LEG8_THEEQ|nr:conserved hypothetical protein [Theileria equi strain WA]EKX73736.1 conserved hypothetical protein [Theileria equi strain WA]|eukprot:XP_004833188.1 conserved hypothetical protein [Theileria equi strain WA]
MARTCHTATLYNLRGRYFSNAPNLPFGEIYHPRQTKEKALQAQIVDKIPFDMVDAWLERNEIAVNTKLEYMPQQFAEARVKYASNPVDFVLSSLLRHCTQSISEGASPGVCNRKRRKTNNSRQSDFCDKTEKKRFIDGAVDKIAECFSELNGAECGIILKCFVKLGYKNPQLQARLIRKTVERGQIFTEYGLLSALNTIVDCLHDSSSLDDVDTPQRLFDSVSPAILKNLRKFSLKSLSILVNILSRSKFNVSRYLNEICNLILSENLSLKQGDDSNLTSEKKEWSENVVHFIANGFSRKNILNKKLFDFLEEHIKPSCHNYNVDTLVSLCNAYSKFGPANDSGYLELYCLLAKKIIARKNELTNRHICVVANAFSKVLVCHEHLLSVIDRILPIRVDSLDHRQASMIIHAFGRLKYKSDNHVLLWNKCTRMLEGHSWQSLTMIFQAYTKGEQLDDVTSRTFCQRFYQLFLSLDESKSSGTTKAENLQPITLLSLVYSLVKSRILFHTELLLMIANECIKCLNIYKGDEIANLTYAFSKIYSKYNATCDKSGNSDSQLVEISHKILLNICKILDDPRADIPTFSVVKIAKAFGDSSFIPAVSSIINLVRRNILLLETFSYSHITILINSLSTLGAHDADLLTILQSIKHRKGTKTKIKNTPEI